MSKEKEKKDNIFKSSFFLKLFLIPSVCWTLLELWVKDVPNDDGSMTTWSELLQETFIVIAVWLIISFIIALVVNEVRKSKPKTKIVKEVQYITKPDDKITVKPEEMKEEIKKELKEEMKKEEPKKKSNRNCRFKCESELTAHEIKILAKNYPNKMYWPYVIRGTVFNLLITVIIAVIFRNNTITSSFFILYQLFVLIYCRVRLESLVQKEFYKMKRNGEIDTKFEIEFYEDYFIRKGEKITYTINYSEITKCIDIDNNLYLEYPSRKAIFNIQKNKCDKELVDFLKTKISNYETKKDIQNNKKKSSIDTFMIILFIITILSFWGAMWTYGIISRLIPQHSLNVVKNMWVFWCWLPIPIASIILGIIFNSKGYKCTKNIVAGIIMCFVLGSFGLFCLFPTFSTDYNNIKEYREYIDADLPSKGELEIQNWGHYFDEDKTEYSVIVAYYDKENVKSLEKSIENSNNWILSTEIKSKLKLMLPSVFNSGEDVYYSIYNKTEDEYNTLPGESGIYEIYAMNYNKTTKELTIHKFKYNYK